MTKYMIFEEDKLRLEKLLEVLTSSGFMQFAGIGITTQTIRNLAEALKDAEECELDDDTFEKTRSDLLKEEREEMMKDIQDLKSVQGTIISSLERMKREVRDQLAYGSKRSALEKVVTTLESLSFELSRIS